MDALVEAIDRLAVARLALSKSRWEASRWERVRHALRSHTGDGAWGVGRAFDSLKQTSAKLISLGFRPIQQAAVPPATCGSFQRLLPVHGAARFIPRGLRTASRWPAWQLVLVRAARTSALTALAGRGSVSAITAATGSAPALFALASALPTAALIAKEAVGRTRRFIEHGQLDQAEALSGIADEHGLNTPTTLLCLTCVFLVGMRLLRRTPAGHQTGKAAAPEHADGYPDHATSSSPPSSHPPLTPPTASTAGIPALSPTPPPTPARPPGRPLLLPPSRLPQPPARPSPRPPARSPPLPSALPPPLPTTSPPPLPPKSVLDDVPPVDYDFLERWVKAVTLAEGQLQAELMLPGTSAADAPPSPQAPKQSRAEVRSLPVKPKLLESDAAPSRPAARRQPRSTTAQPTRQRSLAQLWTNHGEEPRWRKARPPRKRDAWI